MSALIVRLIATYRRFNAEIRHELSRRIPNRLQLAALKGMRLATQDALTRHLREMHHAARLFPTARTQRHAHEGV